MTITIEHGQPKTPFFLVAFPKRPYDEPRGCDGKTIVKLTDGKQTITAAYFGCWEVDFYEMQHYDSFSRIAYGVSAKVVKEQLLKKYPELDKEGSIVEYWILKRV